MKERILFVTNLLPFPLDSGGKIKTYNTLCLLKALYDIDLMCFVDDRKDLRYVNDVEKLCVRVECFYKKIKHHRTPFLFILEIVKSIFSKYPYIISKYTSSQMKKKAIKRMCQYEYKIIYIDHLQLFQYVSPLSFKREEKFLVLDQHNIESEIVKRRIHNTRNLFFRLFLKYEYLKLTRYEKRACSMADLVLAITDIDRDKLNNMTKGQCHCEVSPFFIERKDNARYCSYVQHDKNILFVGTMSWYPNEDAILWFYKNVFLKLRKEHPNIRLDIVGSNPGENIFQLKRDNAVNVTGYVEDINPYLKKAMVAIVPIRIGGGMRIKILQLLAKGIPVVTTSIGCEGIPVTTNKEVLIADNESDIYHAINRIINDSRLREKLSENSLNFIKKYYSFDYALKKYVQILNFLPQNINNNKNIH
jgi:glycosyltransferase involved in cell wall biosynthesis